MHTLEQLESGQLQGIRHLKIAEGLREFPPAIFELADTLEMLDLSGNQLSALPDDFGKLSKLKTLFLSKNRFTELPEVLADCDLDIIGFKTNQIAHISGTCIPHNTRWLILTDNQISHLPDNIGNLHRLQKLMLAGNQLQSLPKSLKHCQNLQLIRIAANQLAHLPEFLLDMPKLSWLAYAGNPFSQHQDEQYPLPTCQSCDFDYLENLGEGASGVIYRAAWQNSPNDLDNTEHVAVKQFKGTVTSDGYPQDELQASLKVGNHPNLPVVLAKLQDDQQDGVVMKLIESSFHNLGLPPSLQSCTRDVFDDDQQYDIDSIWQIAYDIADTLQHMHQQQICHGDLYAHNILIDDSVDETKVLLSDFGAASPLACLTPEQTQRLQTIDVQADGHLLEDLLSLCDETDNEKYHALQTLHAACVEADMDKRPSFEQIVERLRFKF